MTFLNNLFKSDSKGLYRRDPHDILLAERTGFRDENINYLHSTWKKFLSYLENESKQNQEIKVIFILK
jgi:hypothetical protein